MSRLDFLQRNLNKNMSGLEIGPWFNPICPKKNGWNIDILDFSDTDDLITRAATHSSEDIRNRAKDIETVDMVWSGEPIDELCKKKRKKKYDYVVASHLVEHLPDFIGFFQQVSRLLNPSGIISMAVPDMRKCFDVFKYPSTTDQMLAAYRQKHRRHTAENLFSAMANGVNRSGSYSWTDGNRESIRFSDTLDRAWDYYQIESKKSNDAPYVDMHAWYFTPSSFKLLFLELNALGLVDYSPLEICLARGSEFLVQLTRANQTWTSEELNKLRIELHMAIRHELAEEILLVPFERANYLRI
jgi:predicted SAM-dependent methyltransferase